MNLDMNIAEESREAIENNDGTQLACIYFGEDGFPHYSPGPGKRSVAHIQQCDQCRKWLKKLIPQPIFKRHYRMSRYCCPLMYAAIEEPKESRIRIKVLWWRGEAVWLVDQGKKTTLSNSFCFCPWCGGKLPERPFIDDQRGKGYQD